MEAKEIQELISFIANSGLDEVNIETSEFKIKVKRHTEPKIITAAAPSAQPALSTATVASPPITSQPLVQSQPQESAPAPKAEASESKARYVAVKSPMIGTFYRAPSPDKPVFVNVGDEIKKGQVVCIIEAMKLFNEIESEVSGRVVKVLVDNSTPVEYDQELFLVEPL